ncbi:TPA: hypothetical protein ACIGUS_005050, partial [Escherichia coli]
DTPIGICEDKDYLQASCGWRARLNDMVNICELLINIVIPDKPKMLTGLNQKVSDWLSPSSLGIHGHKVTGG